MTRCPLKLVPVVLLGAAALCSGSFAALAGDKIAFSWSSQKTLAMPAAVVPDDQTQDLSLHHSSIDPVPDMGFMQDPGSVVIVASSRNKKQNGRTGKSDSLFGNRQQDGSWGIADDQADDNSDGANSSTNSSRYSLQKAWDPLASQRSDDSGMGYGPDGSRQDSSDVFGRRDRQSDSGFGKDSGRDWSSRTDSSRMDEASSRSFMPQRESVMDILRDRSSSYGSAIDLYKQNQGSDAPQTYGQMESSLFSGAGSARDADSSSESHASFSSSYLSEAGGSRQAEGFQQYSAPSPGGWSAPSSPDPVSQYNSTPAYTQPPPAYVAPPSYSTQLALPRNPGVIGGGY